MSVDAQGASRPSVVGSAGTTRQRAGSWLARRHLERQIRRGGSAALSGHHHVNHVVEIGGHLARLLGVEPGQLGKYRVPIPAVEVVARAWTCESLVLESVREVIPEVPRCIRHFQGTALHSYVPGTVFSQVHRVGEPLCRTTLRTLADFFGRMASLAADRLPQLPADWPADKDTNDFIRHLVGFTDRRVHQANRARFGSLFVALGLREDAMERFMSQIPPLQPRPFSLLHTDLHRDNIVVRPDGSLFVLDWELAMYGDPLHDLATHLVRMGYSDREQTEMTALWVDAMDRRGLSALRDGIDEDLGIYLAYEHAQSAFTNVMRPALSLGPDPLDAELTAAAQRIQTALQLAEEPLGRTLVTDLPRIESALRSWHAVDSPVPRSRPGG
jgi:hypothetical protein